MLSVGMLRMSTPLVVWFLPASGSPALLLDACFTVCILALLFIGMPSATNTVPMELMS